MTQETQAKPKLPFWQEVKKGAIGGAIVGAIAMLFIYLLAVFAGPDPIGFLTNLRAALVFAGLGVGTALIGALGGGAMAALGARKDKPQ